MATHKHKSKTHQQMLPQSAALEACAISPQGAKRRQTAGAVHCRGERQAYRPARNHTATCETGRVTAPSIFVLAKSKNPLMPCHPARARQLLKHKKAVVSRRLPFVIRLKNRTVGNTQPVQLKLDPGAKTTGIALTTSQKVLNLFELAHRKEQVKKKMEQRKNYRRRRRTANLRCRPARFLNRGKAGKIAPSVRSVLDNTQGWINRLRRWTPITGIVIETVKFDAHKMQNPEISGIEYQQGTLQGFEVKEYLLEKHRRKCAYCNKGETPLEIEHIVAKANGGSNRISNLTLACVPCNLEKESKDVTVFLQGKPTRLKRILADAKKPLHTCATMNTMRPRLLAAARHTGLPVTTGTGAETKFNRNRFGIPKTHALDAAFAGTMDTSLTGWNITPVCIKATGRGSYQRTRTDKFGFPRLRLPRTKMVRGFQTGDLVQSPKGTGRVATRSSGHFALTSNHTKTTVKQNTCRLLQRADGYSYSSKQAHGTSVDTTP
jgi:5-methylcytosine-specific restriction endonuclease McrA